VLAELTLQGASQVRNDPRFLRLGLRLFFRSELLPVLCPVFSGGQLLSGAWRYRLCRSSLLLNKSLATTVCSRVNCYRLRVASRVAQVV
jgi:hypothetical protein